MNSMEGRHVRRLSSRLGGETLYDSELRELVAVLGERRLSAPRWIAEGIQVHAQGPHTKKDALARTSGRLAYALLEASLRPEQKELIDDDQLRLLCRQVVYVEVELEGLLGSASGPEFVKTLGDGFSRRLKTYVFGVFAARDLAERQWLKEKRDAVIGMLAELVVCGFLSQPGLYRRLLRLVMSPQDEGEKRRLVACVCYAVDNGLKNHYGRKAEDGETVVSLQQRMYGLSGEQAGKLGTPLVDPGGPAQFTGFLARDPYFREVAQQAKTYVAQACQGVN
jgi:hypothetical protein